MVETASQKAWNDFRMRKPVLREHEDAEFRILPEVSRKIPSMPDTDQLLLQVVCPIRKRFGQYYVGIGRIEGGGKQVLSSSSGRGAPRLVRRESPGLGRGVLMRTVAEVTP
jgi:hypothetical protein